MSQTKTIANDGNKKFNPYQSANLTQRAMYSQSQLYIDVSSVPNAGRGLFAGRKYLKNEIIDIVPLVAVTDDGQDIPLEIKNIIYRMEEHCYFIPGGYMMFVCHKQPANVYYCIDPIKQQMTVIAAEDIEENEEIFISYCSEDGSTHCAHSWCNKLWINEDGVWETSCGAKGG